MKLGIWESFLCVTSYLKAKLFPVKNPKNFEDEFAGVVTLRFALALSINTVAAQVALSTGLDNVVNVAKSAGFEGDIKPLPSLSLGAMDAPPLDVARAYTTLANFGLRRELTSTLAVVGEDGRAVAKFLPKDEQVIPKEEAANLVQIMTTVFEDGTARPARAAASAVVSISNWNSIHGPGRLLGFTFWRR